MAALVPASQGLAAEVAVLARLEVTDQVLLVRRAQMVVLD
jgi:hypothetical protein